MTTVEREKLFRVARNVAELIWAESDKGKMLYRNACQIYSMLLDKACVYLTDNLGSPLSFCGWYLYQDGSIEVGSTITDPAHRGRGLATECLYRVLSTIQDSERRIMAFCNDDSTSLFRRVGFAELPKVEMPDEAKSSCASCKEFASFPDCHCRYLVFPYAVAKSRKDVWHTLIENPSGALLSECADTYCGVWAEPPWEEYDWDKAEVERELRDASLDPTTLFFASMLKGKVNGFTLGYPLDSDGLRMKCGGNQLDGLSRGYPQLFYVAELGVAADSRNLGTGSLLSGTLLEKAEKRGFTRFILRTDLMADPARGLYAKLGFVDTGIADSNHPSRTYWVRDI